MGNELGQYDELPKPRALFADIARQYDPQRFFIDSDGVNGNVLQDPKSDRDMLDFYPIQFNDPGANPIDTLFFENFDGPTSRFPPGPGRRWRCRNPRRIAPP